MSASVPSTILHADSRKGKLGLSCAECRRSVTYTHSEILEASNSPHRMFRSKLKCDRCVLLSTRWRPVSSEPEQRVFPCQSCIRRGCAAICPDGQRSSLGWVIILTSPCRDSGRNEGKQVGRTPNV